MAADVVGINSGLAVVNDHFASGMTDGLPVMPATDARIGALIAASGRAGDATLGVFSTSGRPVTVAGVARCAALAGCLPEYMPLVITAFEGLLEPRFPIRLLVDSRGSFFPLLLVNGPVRRSLEINCGSNLFGPGFRANATIGRALRLGLIELAGATPTSGDRSALGSAYKYTCVIGEDEEASPWPPLHTEFGFQATEDTVMVLVARQMSNVTNQVTAEPEELLRGVAEEVTTATHVNPIDADMPAGALNRKALLVLADDHRKLMRERGWSRRRIQEVLWEAASRSVGALRAAGFRADDRLGPGAGDEVRVRMYDSPEDFLVISGGGVSGREMMGSTVYADIRRVPPRSTSSAGAAGGADAGSSPSSPSSGDDYVAVVDQYIEQGYTDGLPVLSPDASAVAQMVAASGRGADDVLGHHFWRSAPITTTDAAVNAYLAGCRPEYMPIVVAAYELVFAPTDPDHARDAVAAVGAAASAGSFFPWLVVNGPAVQEIGLNTRGNLFGPGFRANATIGRALRLGMRNLAALKPDLLDRSSVGHAFKYSCVVAEENDGAGWGEPLHVNLGFDRDESVVTVVWGDCPRLTLHDEAREPEQLLRAVAEETSTITRMDSTSARSDEEMDSLESYNAADRYERVVLLGGGHRELLRRAGWSRRQASEFLAAHIGRRVGHARARGYRRSAGIRPDQADHEWVRMVPGPDNVHVLAAGGPGGATMSDICFYRASRVIGTG